MPVLKSPKGNIFYVYQLTDPRTDEVFYVGKGQGNRKDAHVREAKVGRGANIPKVERIREVLRAGLDVVVEIIEDQLTEARALQLERHTIEGFPPSQLTNLVAGQQTKAEIGSLSYGYLIRRLRTEDEWWVFFARAKNRFPTKDEMSLYRDVSGEIFNEFRTFIVDMHKSGVEIPRAAIEALVLMRKRHGKGIEQEAR